MIKERELNAQAAPAPWAAARDAQQRNAFYRATYTPKQRAKAQSLFDLLDNVYTYDKMYMNFRKKFIAIKIEEGHVKDKEARDFDLYIESEGIRKVRTDQGIIFRITR